MSGELQVGDRVRKIGPVNGTDLEQEGEVKRVDEVVKDGRVVGTKVVVECAAGGRVWKLQNATNFARLLEDAAERPTVSQQAVGAAAALPCAAGTYSDAADLASQEGCTPCSAVQVRSVDGSTSNCHTTSLLRKCAKGEISPDCDATSAQCECSGGPKGEASLCAREGYYIPPRFEIEVDGERMLSVPLELAKRVEGTDDDDQGPPRHFFESVNATAVRLLDGDGRARMGFAAASGEVGHEQYEVSRWEFERISLEKPLK